MPNKKENTYKHECMILLKKTRTYMQEMKWAVTGSWGKEIVKKMRESWELGEDLGSLVPWAWWWGKKERVCGSRKEKRDCREMKEEMGFRAYCRTFGEFAYRTLGLGTLYNKVLGLTVWTYIWVLGQGGFNDGSKSWMPCMITLSISPHSTNLSD